MSMSAMFDLSDSIEVGVFVNISNTVIFAASPML